MASDMLPPGFRFHPTDVELVMYWLKRKILGKKLQFEAISEINICAYDPEELPAKSCLKSGDREWFFFWPLEKRGDRAKRSTPNGFWKTSGNDRHVLYNGESTGKVRTLIFHIRKDPKPERTNWVIHEYRLTDPSLAERGIQQDSYVLCKIFQKNGFGPQNGAQYGAPFREEDWDEEGDDDFPVNVVLPITSKPTNQTPITIDENNTTMPQSTTVESLFEACPSSSLQQLPYEHQEVGDDPLMSGFYLDEFLNPPIENARNEEQANAIMVQDNGIYDGLGDLQEELHYATNRFELMDGDYLELPDLDNPLYFPEHFADPIAVEPTACGPFQLENAADSSGYEAASSVPITDSVAASKPNKRLREDSSTESSIERVLKPKR